MKIRIDFDENTTENEIIIKCRELDDTIQKLQQMILQFSKKVDMLFYKGTTEYYLPLSSIIFFETSENGIYAHSVDDIYKIKYKLYELEELLPINFIRISKSTILNVDHIYSIDRNLTTSSCITLNNTHKKVYASRSYYKSLKTCLDERRKS